MAHFNLDMEVEYDVVKNQLNNFLSMNSNFGIILMSYFWTHTTLCCQKMSRSSFWTYDVLGLEMKFFKKSYIDQKYRDMSSQVIISTSIFGIFCILAFLCYNIVMEDQDLDETSLSMCWQLQHCRSISAKKFSQRMTNNVKLTICVSDATRADYNYYWAR